jgi:hypothetical protein
LAIAKQAASLAGDSGALFPHLPVGGLLKLVVQMGFAGKHSPHGSRSSFRTWLSEATTFENELGEIALGHQVGTEVSRRYMRGDMLDKRARMMRAWSDFLAGVEATAEVVAIGAGKRKRR